MEFKNIAVSGRIGAGTSTLVKQLSQTLGWPLRDASQIFRDVSLHSGFDLEKNPQKYADEIDLQVDNETISTLKSLSSVVVTSKLAGFLSRDISHALRILIACPVEERIRRYAVSRGYSIDKAKELLILREKLDQEKWSHLYGHHDFLNPRYFQLVLDSTVMTPEEEVDLISRHLNWTQNLC
ncbi:cytidylate kinase family protein [Candidatus Collierbacteria bacterium]|nr:cytidylate kinase family protein [Candidatus Collierbacteria bacterium]